MRSQMKDKVFNTLEVLALFVMACSITVAGHYILGPLGFMWVGYKLYRLVRGIE